ncbi:DUF4175 family protein [Mangrovibacterium sp.]|uniref:DUF4175 family protein n=1 Tax=Mangrovibacterium sp. TaxID=1961364 RepID=UPI003564AB89
MTNNYGLLVEKLNFYSRKYFSFLLFKGVLLLISILTICISVVLLIEYNFYTSTSIRLVFLVSCLLLGLYITVVYVVQSVLYFTGIRKYSLLQKAKLVSQHFPELKDQLINIVELGSMNEQGELVFSSINQKIGKLSPFSFSSYFSFRLIKNNLFVFVLALAVTAGASFAFPGFLAEGGYRVLHFNQAFVKPAPFRFVLVNEDTAVRKGSSLELQVLCEGKNLPEYLYINIGGTNFIMEQGEQFFTYKLEHIQNSFSIYFTDNEYVSEKYTVFVVPDPIVLNFSLEVKVPEYTGTNNYVLNNVGNVEVPYGSKLVWKFNCADTDSLFLQTGAERIAAAKNGDQFSVDYQAFSESNYKIVVKNDFVPTKELVQYTIGVIPDFFPEIAVGQYQDSVVLSRFYFKGEIGDDYGFKDLVFKLKSAERDSTFQLNILPGLKVQEFYYFVDLKDYRSFGESFSFYFSVRDNDPFHQFKESTSEVFNFKFLDGNEVDTINNQLFDEIESLVAESKRITDDIKREIEDYKYRDISEKLNDWDRKQLLNNVLKKKEQLQSVIEQISNKNTQMNSVKNSFGEQTNDLLEKQQQINDLLNEVMSDELKELLDEFNKLANQFDPLRMNELLDKMSFPMDDLTKQLDRSLEMLKRMKIEQKLDELLSIVDETAKSENNNLKYVESNELEKLAENEQLNQEAIEKFDQDFKEILEFNKELQKEMKLFPLDNEIENINNKFNEISESIQGKRRNKLKDQIGENKQMLEDLAFSLQQMLNANESNQIGENIDNLKQILKNLIYLSLGQEEILNLTTEIDINDPLLNSVQEKQDLILVQSKQVADSLYALSMRTPAVSSKIGSELSKIDFSIRQSIEGLRNGLIGGVAKFQQGTMTAFNELALLLNEALENLEKAMANSMPGDQQCDKPGQGGKTSMQKLKEGQQSLKDQLQRMIEGLKNGSSGKLSEQIGKSLIQQEMLKQMIGEMLLDEGVGSSAKEQLRGVDQLIEQNRVDLIQKKLGNQLISRQNLILERLLKAEKSEMERDVDDKRESKTAEQVFYSNPELFFQYKDVEKNKEEEIRYNNYRLHNFYDKKFRDYLNLVNR